MGRKEEEEGEIKSRMSREHVSNSYSLQQQAHRADRGWQGREAGKDLVFRGPCELCSRPRVWDRMQMKWMSLLEVPTAALLPCLLSPPGLSLSK